MLTDLEAFLACVFCFGLGLVVALEKIAEALEKMVKQNASGRF